MPPIPPSSSEYQLLPNDDHPALLGNQRGRQYCALSQFWLWCIIIFFFIETTALLSVVAILGGRQQPGQYLYSPAEDATSHRLVRFFDDGPAPLYQDPPSTELDARWEALYNFGISRIPLQQAARLPDRTEAISGDEDHYIVQLDVFHQLHCLNLIRKALYSSSTHYPDMNMSDAGTMRHISHCLDSIRQSLMCSADTSVIVWQWNNTEKASSPKFDILHQCKDFDKIKDWALHRRTIVRFNPTRHVESEPQ